LSNIDNGILSKVDRIIWVDLDEVLAELLDYILEYNDNKIWDYVINKSDIKDYYIHKMEWIDLTLEQSIAWFKDAIISDVDNYKIKALHWARDKLIQLKVSGHKLIIITARAEEHYWDYTRKWVEINYPEIFDDIIFADHFHENHREKHEICLEEWITCMIEDNYDYAISLANAWIVTYLLEKPWNNWQEIYHENIIRIKSWEEVEL
jgi:uncharacterized HAD superfamily protein